MHFQTVMQVAARLRAREINSGELTELMLQRIKALNGRLNAYVTVTADEACEQAQLMDEELAGGRDRGPLHGIPVAVKDLFDTAGVRTTCGSRLFEDRVPERDAWAVKCLREAGAVILGKTGLHELAYGNSSINPFFGPIANPWALDHDPGGSSGGSAAAVSAGLAYAALGSDTGCSIRQPAHCCGIVGYKPTFGLVSKSGVLPLVWSMDHVGPLTRSVEDAAVVLKVLAGHDPADPYSQREARFEDIDTSRADIDGMRVGVVRRFFFEGYADVIEVVDEALKGLGQLGAEILELDINDIEEAFTSAGTTFAEAGAVHAEAVSARPDMFSDEVRDKLLGALDMPATRYIQAQHFRRGFTARMEKLMESCDVLATPTATISAAPIRVRPKDYSTHAWKNTGIFNFTGQPSISIPCGLTRSGLPVGLMLTGGLGCDRRLLGLAHTLEQTAGWQVTSPNI